MSRFDRKEQNSLKQLSFNKKIKKKTFNAQIFIDHIVCAMHLGAVKIVVGKNRPRLCVHRTFSLVGKKAIHQTSTLISE